MNMQPTRRSQRASRRGNYAILVGVSFSVLLGFAAIAIDSAFVNLAFVQAQAAADAGAHAAIVKLRRSGDVDEARVTAEDFINANNLMGNAAKVDPAEDIIFGGWDYGSRTFDEGAAYVNAVRVNVRKTDDSPNGAMQTLMMKLFGVQFSEARATAPSTAALRFREIMIVQDVTGSFAGEIGQGRNADLTFLETIAERNNPGDQIGMVTFVGAAELWTPLSYVDTEFNTIRDQWETLDWCDRSYAPWNSYAPPIYHPAPQMIGCNAGQTNPSTSHYDSGTNQGAGINKALDTLLTGVGASANALKVIVLVSDGKPQCIPSTALCDNAVAAEGRLAADDAEDNNVSIFSVSFNDTYDANQSAYMEDLVRGYGRFYETPDPNDLGAILEEIARAIPVALVE